MPAFVATDLFTPRAERQVGSFLSAPEAGWRLSRVSQEADNFALILHPRNPCRISRTGKLVSLLVVGSVAFDAIESPYGKVDRIIGGAATYFAVAASFFTPVNLVGIVGDDFSATDATIFKNRQIDTAGLERP